MDWCWNLVNTVKSDVKRLEWTIFVIMLKIFMQRNCEEEKKETLECKKQDSGEGTKTKVVETNKPMHLDFSYKKLIMSHEAPGILQQCKIP